MKADHDDEVAASYDRENSHSLLNAYDNRPALVTLAFILEER